MPFDGLANNSFAAVCRRLGMQPIPQDVLERHKQAQIEAHPPSLLYGRQSFLGACVLGVLLLQFGCAVVTLFDLGRMLLSEVIGWPAPLPGSVSLWSAVLGPLMVIVGMAAIGFLMSLKVRGPAKWHWRYLGFRELAALKIPASIYKAASELNALHPLTFEYGELRQEKVLLDPYLIAHYKGESVVLGIWDGDRVLHTARP